MTPEERKLVTDLFDRLATVEDAQRDPDAERLMKDGLRQAPNALYALVQTVLVQDEALKRADGRIRELEQTLDDIDQQQQPPPRDTSFLGGVRDSLLGRRGSVPSVPANEAGPGMSQSSGSGTQGPGTQGPGTQGPGMSQAWRTGAPTGGPGYAPPPGYGGAPVAQSGMPQGGMPMAQGGMPQGGSFLGTAAAAATGAIGGSLLMNGIRNLMGGHQGGTAHAAADPSGGLGGSAGAGAAPWGGSAAGSDLSRQAGAGDVGRPHSQVNDSHAGDADDQRLADQNQDDDQDADEDDDYDDDDGGDDSDE
jgi:hypothetical protein